MKSADHLFNVLLNNMSVDKDVLELLFQINLSLPSNLIPQTRYCGHGDKTLCVGPPTEPGINKHDISSCLFCHLESSILC